MQVISGIDATRGHATEKVARREEQVAELKSAVQKLKDTFAASVKRFLEEKKRTAGKNRRCLDAFAGTSLHEITSCELLVL